MGGVWRTGAASAHQASPGLLVTFAYRPGEAPAVTQDAVGTRHVVGMGDAWRINHVNVRLDGAEGIVTYAVPEPTTSAAHNAM